MNKLKVFVVCSGLGRINRGYESFFRDCFDALCNEPSLDMTLFKGNGDNKDKEICLWNISRNSKAANWLGKMIGRGGYFVEQLTFFMALLPYILFQKPDVIYVSDVTLGNFIHLLREFTNAKYRILFNNNGPVLPQLLDRWDHIQQVSPQYLRAGLEVGIAENQQTLLPSAINISEAFKPSRGVDQGVLRKQLGLPKDRRIILSVGSISKNRKRMNYIIQEVASLQEPRPFLLLLGERASDTQEIVNLGNLLLSEEGFSAKTVVKDEVSDYYRAADLFTLASLDEGFGLVYVEAMSFGLPCLIHDYETARFVLGGMGYYGDLTQPGGLTQLISSYLRREFNFEEAILRHAYTYKNFSWDHLRGQYLDLLQRCAG